MTFDGQTQPCFVLHFSLVFTHRVIRWVMYCMSFDVQLNLLCLCITLLFFNSPCLSLVKLNLPNSWFYSPCHSTVKLNLLCFASSLFFSCIVIYGQTYQICLFWYSVARRLVHCIWCKGSIYRLFWIRQHTHSTSALCQRHAAGSRGPTRQ